MAEPRFFEAAFSRTGLLWLLAAACITWIPLLAVGILARLWLKLDFAAITGLLAGETTDPPALAFANGLIGSDAPTVAYATVYPLTTLLRMVVMQVIVLTVCE
jgi:putative transport protein